jgi:F0F1-type ATP synthase assembly protein I
VPWLECFLALILSFTIGRKTDECSTTQGLLIGILAGMLGLAVALFFRGHPSTSSMIFSFGVAGTGYIGGLLGEKWPAKK